MEVNLHVCSWNLGGVMPDESLDLSKLLKAGSTQPYACSYPASDVVVIGLQEFVKLNIKSVMSGPDEKRLKAWKQLVEAHLKSLYPSAKYANFHSVVMMGLCIIVYGEKRILGLISNIKTGRVKTGMHGMGKNKGSVILRCFP